MAHGAAWMIAARLLDRVLGLLSTLILARLLVPADFGLIAMATTTLALLEALTSFGFDAALVRHPGARREHYDTVWTVNALLGAVIGIGLLLAAIPATWFFREPRLAPIMAVLAVIVVVRGLENVGVIALEKELHFKRVFVFIAGKKAAMFGAGVLLAFVLRDYRALLGGMAAGALAGVALSYLLHAFRPRLSLSCWHELFAFSRWLLLKNLMDFVRLRYADLMVGRVAGPGALGVYSVGAEIATLPTTELVAPINRAVLPGYAMMVRDPNELRNGYLAVLGVVAVLALPAAFGIAAIASLVVPTLLGPHWSAAIEVVQVLAWVGALHVLQSNSYPVYLALGKPWIAAALSAAHAILLAVALPALGMRWGLSGVMVGVLVSNAASFPVGLAITMRLLQLSVAECLTVLLRPLAASALMYFAVAHYAGGVEDPSSVLSLISAIALGIACYVTVLAALWWARGRPNGAESAILLRLRNWMSAAGSSP